MASSRPKPHEDEDEPLKGVPAALVGECADCGSKFIRSGLRVFGERLLCPDCFDRFLVTASDSIRTLTRRMDEPERLCGNCRAMTDPTVGSEWCSVLELGEVRAKLCDRFVSVKLHQEVVEAQAVEIQPVTALDIWSLVCSDLDTSLGPAHVQWLRETRPLALEGHVLIVAAEDDYTRSWLVARLMPAIARSLELNGFADVSVEFVPMPAGSPPQKLVKDKSSGPATLPLQPVPPSAARPDAPAQPHQASGFNPAFCFAEFVVGTGNRLAHAGAVAISDGSNAYNPLYIHGEVGVGKTHLLQAIGGKCIERGRRALYVSSETFTNELIAAIRAGDTPGFRHRYREIDVLLVDDIHFIIGKESTQDEFFHTFNWLYDNSKQIVLSSDRAPNEMRILDARLRSRFCWGLTADIQRPDLETRIEILRKKTAQRGRVVDDEVLEYLARQTRQNVRELEGMLNKLLAVSEIHRMPPTLTLAATLAAERLGSREVGPKDVLDAVCAYYRLNQAGLAGKQRGRAVSVPRHVAMYLLREDAHLSLPHIGELLGGRDHTTVIYGCKRVASNLRSDAKVRNDVEAIRALIA